MKKIGYYYLMPEVWETVTDSQIFSWLNLLSGEGYAVHCISFTKIGKKRKTAVNLSRIRGKIGGGLFYQFPILKKGNILIDIQVFFILLFFYLKNCHGYNKVVFQSRISGYSFAFYALKKIINFKLIFDLRDDKIEELKYLPDKYKSKFFNTLRNWLHLLHEKTMLHTSDKIICVSQHLKWHVHEHYHIDKNKIIVIPNVADSKKFFFDKEIRNSYRKKLKIEKKTVFVYSGTLSRKWNIPEKIFELFVIISSCVKNAYLLIFKGKFC